jgi:hypothetical protein
MFACWWLIPLGLPDTSHAQVTPPITSSGLNTHISKPSGNSLQYDITAGTRAGTNLFHSFGDFSVPTNNIANFLNDSGLATSNILGRVTGGNPSQHFRHPPNDRLRRSQSVPDESRRDCLWAECRAECRGIREFHHR